jgi:hypothetical protein
MDPQPAPPRPPLLFAVLLRSEADWFPLSSGSIADALRSNYEVVPYVPMADLVAAASDRSMIRPVAREVAVGEDTVQRTVKLFLQEFAERHHGV